LKEFLCHSIASDFYTNFHENSGKLMANERRLLASILLTSGNLGQVTTKKQEKPQGH